MPKFDNPSDVITWITRIDKGEALMQSHIPSYLAIRGLARSGEREVLVTESAARDLLEKLNDIVRSSR